MRRSQIAGAAKDGPADGRMAFRDLISFDLKRVFDPDELALAEKRVGAFNHAPMLLAASHAIWGVTLIIHCLGHYSFGQMILPIVLLSVLLLADGALALLMRASTTGNLPAHLVTRAVCGALGGTGLLWMIFAATTHSAGHASNETVATMALGVGLAISAMVPAYPTPMKTPPRAKNPNANERIAPSNATPPSASGTTAISRATTR